MTRKIKVTLFCIENSICKVQKSAGPTSGECTKHHNLTHSFRPSDQQAYYKSLALTGDGLWRASVNYGSINLFARHTSTYDVF